MTTQLITIDGPVASGKGTIAFLVAQNLGWRYLDSGALYRLVALEAINHHISFTCESELANLVFNMQIHFSEGKIFLNEQEVSSEIREESISMAASQIAILPKLREALLHKQRLYALDCNLVADGRDMGTVVFPNAHLKIYLTASVEERAKRRAKQLGIAIETKQYQEIYQDILIRDERDKNRQIAPLKPADNARILDSSDLTIDDTVKKIINWYHELNK